jgi:hypothetical protein
VAYDGEMAIRELRDRVTDLEKQLAEVWDYLQERERAEEREREAQWEADNA